MKVSKNPEWQQELRAAIIGRNGKESTLTSEERCRAVCDEIDAAEAERTQLTLNLEFTKIREGAQLNPREIRIDLETNTLVDAEVDGDRRKAFAKGLFLTKDKQPVPDASACARNFEEAYEAYVDIKGQDREKVISGLRERVEGMQLQTRGELAQALGCSASALDALLQQHDLRNTDIGLKSTPGRKRHRQ